MAYAAGVGPWRTAQRLKLCVPKALCYRRPGPGGLAAIGDSITSGTSWPEWGLLGRDSWVSHLVVDRTVPYCFNGALAETRTPLLVERIPALLAHRPGVLVLVVGGFDVWKRQHEQGIHDVSAMVDACAAQGVVAIIGTLPPIRDYGAAICDFNGRLRVLAEHRGLPVIDFHAALVVDGEYGPGLSDDGLHPTEAGAKVMASVARPVVMAHVSRPDAGRDP